jgi:hypothetical protein
MLATIPGILGPDLCRVACDYARLKTETGDMQLGDPQILHSYAAYGDPLMDVILASLQPRIESVTGHTLLPTHSYVRVHGSGASLARHRDRESCEVSVTITLGTEAAEPWPFWVEAGGKVHQILLTAGDGFLYPGLDVDHWRDEFLGVWQVQLTLHYVTQGGPYEAWRFDKRPGLGRHYGTRRL